MVGGLWNVWVSTHSRLKAAALGITLVTYKGIVSTHSRLKAAAERVKKTQEINLVSTHSRLKAAAAGQVQSMTTIRFQHTAA